MTTFFEQVADTAEWQPATQHHPDTRAGARQQARAADTAEAMTALARNRRAGLLSRVVETEVLPRLAVARGVAASKSSGGTKPYVTTETDAAELVRLLLTQEAVNAIEFINALQLRGVTLAAIYLGIVSQSARRLGELWEEDRADFAQVTIGLGRLQQVVRGLSAKFQTAAVMRAHPETVLLIPAPGSQHTFGLVLLAEFFRREGWHVIGGPLPCENAELVALVSERWVDVAGFSIGSTGQLENLTKSIRLARRVSRNRDLGVMVGGPLLLQRPDLVARVGADMTATDAESAVRRASGLVAIRAAAD